jgi:hypothetical protein
MANGTYGEGTPTPYPSDPPTREQGNYPGSDGTPSDNA